MRGCSCNASCCPFCLPDESEGASGHPTAADASSAIVGQGTGKREGGVRSREQSAEPGTKTNQPSAAPRGRPRMRVHAHGAGARAYATRETSPGASPFLPGLEGRAGREGDHAANAPAALPASKAPTNSYAGNRPSDIHAAIAVSAASNRPEGQSSSPTASARNTAKQTSPAVHHGASGGGFEGAASRGGGQVSPALSATSAIDADARLLCEIVTDSYDPNPERLADAVWAAESLLGRRGDAQSAVQSRGHVSDPRERRRLLSAVVRARWSINLSVTAKRCTS